MCPHDPKYRISFKMGEGMFAPLENIHPFPLNFKMKVSQNASEAI